ncbi:MAG: flagellar basal-body rod protein FlgF [Alphaproteobacteria bacterium]
MINTKYVALSRQIALWNQMDTVSNNVANVNTTGFKAEDAIFSEYITDTPKAKGVASDPVYFTQNFGTYKNFNEGAIVETGNALDLAIDGEGFFAVATQNGEQYTRKGNFTLNAEGALVTNEGHYVLSTDNKPIIFAPEETDISISGDGSVYSTQIEAGISQNNFVANIKLINFENPQELTKTAGTLFEANENSNAIASNAVLKQGAIEKSNVEGVVEMTRLVKLQRSYEYVQQMIDAEHERLSNTISAYRQMI